jgi:transcriptional regulator with XRE-family HTH domain
MATTLKLRTDQLTKLRKLAGLDTNAALAQRMNFDAGNLSRVLAGKQQPGPKFMAALVSAFPGFSLDDLFEVVGDTKAAA